MHSFLGVLFFLMLSNMIVVCLRVEGGVTV